MQLQIITDSKSAVQKQQEEEKQNSSEQKNIAQRQNWPQWHNGPNHMDNMLQYQQQIHALIATTWLAMINDCEKWMAMINDCEKWLNDRYNKEKDFTEQF